MLKVFYEYAGIVKPTNMSNILPTSGFILWAGLESNVDNAYNQGYTPTSSNYYSNSRDISPSYAICLSE